jgi:hypothetical protein
MQFCQGQQIDAEHQKKAEKIIEGVVSGKKLPKKMFGDLPTQDFSNDPGMHRLFYWGKRTVDGLLTSKVSMIAYINDSEKNLDFDENYQQISDTLMNYHYNIQKGELTWAYNYIHLPDSLQKTPIYMADGSVVYPDDSKHDTTLMIDKNNWYGFTDKELLEKHRERDRKSFAFYEPKLLASIDELYDLLFK